MSSLEPLCNFRRNPCSLELTASVVSAAVLCRQAAMMNPTNPPEKVQDILALPPAIEQKIQRFMPIVKEQIASWSNFYDRQIFVHALSSQAHKYFHVLVWSADGTINEEETAREMLKQDGLNTAKKYRIACNHCLENEIRALWSNLKTKIRNRNLRSSERYFREYPLVYHWELVRSLGRVTGGMKMHIIEYVFNVGDNYPACVTDYFLNQFLDSQKRIDYIPSSCLQKMSFRSWENFLMKLTNEQLAWLFKDFKMWKLVDSMRFWLHADFVVQIWMRILDKYPDDVFSDLIEELLKCENSESQSTDHISLAVEIFNLAPYEMQKRVFHDYHVEDWWDRDSNLTDIRLDVAILSAIDPNYRRHEFWAMQWINVFKKYPTECFMQFMDVCCEEEGSEEFKMEVMEMDDYWSSEHCCTLLMEMRFSEIDHFLSIFSSDSSRIMKTKQKILRQNIFGWRARLYETDRFIFPPPNQLVDFIEGSFENIRSANEYKMEVLSSVDCLDACYEDAGNDIFDWLKDAVWMCSFNDDDFKRYKSMFLQLDVELAKSFGITDIFIDPGWKSFLEWCSDES